MQQNLRQSMAWLHTWVGLLPGWVLYVIFVFGTAAFFQHEIDAWMRPELGAPPRVSPRALAAADAALHVRAGGAESWSVSMPDPRGGSGLEVSWRRPGQKRHDETTLTLDPATGAQLAPRDTKGGYFLYRFHFDLHYMSVAWARYLVSVAALAMLVAILSGVVTHKKIFADFFMLRFGKGQRSWLDAHNATAVLALPFYLMMTYTGLVTLLFTLMPWAIAVNFPSRQDFYKSVYAAAPEREPGGIAAATMPLPGMVAVAERQWGGVRPTYISVTHPGDAAAVVTLYPGRADWGSASLDTLHLDGATGIVLPSTRVSPGAASATQRVMIDLHTAWFAGYGLRWLYFVSGLGGVAMVATGLCLWCVKRRARLPDPARPHIGFRLVEGLNIGFIVGAPIGIAVYFLANRLLRPDLADRAAWEINMLFIAWGATVVWAFVRPAQRAWVETLTAGATLFAVVPLVNALTTARGLLPSLLVRDWVFAGFDLAMLVLAGGFALAARRLSMRKPREAARHRPRKEAAA